MINPIADNQIEVLFITGQPGVGKTAVAKEISEQLWQLREPHSVIDLDELCRGLLPTKSTDFNHSLAVANLKAVWSNFHAAGVQRLILARIIESSDDIAHFVDTIPDAQVTVCLLHANQDTIQQRITEREQGSARDFLLSLTSRIAEKTDSLVFPCIRINNDQRSLVEVAREILIRADWLRLPG